MLAGDDKLWRDELVGYVISLSLTRHRIHWRADALTCSRNHSCDFKVHLVDLRRGGCFSLIGAEDANCGVVSKVSVDGCLLTILVYVLLPAIAETLRAFARDIPIGVLQDVHYLA